MKWMTTALTAILVAICCQVCSAQASWVEGFYRPVGIGYEVSYVLHNYWPDREFSSFLVYATNDKAATSPSGPSGWRIWNDPRCGIEWMALSSDYYVKAGSSMGGFTYTTAVPPGTLSWALRLIVGDYYHSSVTPVLVPEPSSLAALGGGMMGLLALRRRRR